MSPTGSGIGFVLLWVATMTAGHGVDASLHIKAIESIPAADLPVVWINRSEVAWPCSQYSIGSSSWPAFATGYRCYGEQFERRPLTLAGTNGILLHDSDGGLVLIDRDNGSTVWTSYQSSCTYSATYATTRRVSIWDAQAQTLTILDAATGRKLDAITLDLPSPRDKENRLAWMFGGPTPETLTLVRQHGAADGTWSLAGIDIDEREVRWRHPSDGTALQASWPLLTADRACWMTPDGTLAILRTRDGSVTHMATGLPPVRPHNAASSFAIRPAAEGRILIRFAPPRGRGALLCVDLSSAHSVTSIDGPSVTTQSKGGMPLLDLSTGLWRVAPSRPEVPTDGSAFLVGDEIWSLEWSATGDGTSLRRHAREGEADGILSGLFAGDAVGYADGSLFTQGSHGGLARIRTAKAGSEAYGGLRSSVLNGLCCAIRSKDTNAVVTLGKTAVDNFLMDDEITLAIELGFHAVPDVASPLVRGYPFEPAIQLQKLLGPLARTREDSPVRALLVDWFRERAGIEHCLAFDNRSPVVSGDGGRVLLATDSDSDGPTVPHTNRIVAIDAASGSIVWQHAVAEPLRAVGIVDNMAIAGAGSLAANGQWFDGSHVTVYDWTTGITIAEGDWGNIGLDYARPIQEHDHRTPWRSRGIVARPAESDTACLLTLKTDDLRGVDPATGRILWSVDGFARRGRKEYLAAIDAGDSFLVAIPGGAGMQLSCRRWSDGKAAWETSLATGGLDEGDGPAILAKWRNGFWVTRQGYRRYWQIAPGAGTCEEHILTDKDAVKWFTVDPYSGALSIEFDNNSSGNIGEKAWRQKRDPRPWVLLTPTTFGNRCGLDAVALWCIPGNPGKRVVFMNNPTVSVLTIDVRAFLSLLHANAPDLLGMLVANIDATYVEPRIPTGKERARMQALVAGLGAASFPERENAEHALRGEGVRALPVLQEALASDDPEITARASRLIRSIEQQSR